MHDRTQQISETFFSEKYFLCTYMYFITFTKFYGSVNVFFLYYTMNQAFIYLVYFKIMGYFQRR